MSYWPPDDQEEVLVLSTQKTKPRWLRFLLKFLLVALILGILGAGVIAWRYHMVQQRVKQDLATVIQQEEHIRSLGAINAAPDIIDPRASGSWRFRYLSSVRARKDRPEPAIQVQAVDYDGADARATLHVDGVIQHRHYHLYTNKDWRRSPFAATGWGQRQELPNVGGFDIIYWDEDAAFAQNLAQTLPDLLAQMRQLALEPSSGQLMIIPQEFGDLTRPSEMTAGWVINSAHVDWIESPPLGLTPSQTLRARLGQNLTSQARKNTQISSSLPGAARVQSAIDEILVWQWAAGDVPAIKIAAWQSKLKGRWVSPTTGLTSDLITELPPDAPDAASRLMMSWLLQEHGPNALLALSTAMTTASSWDEAYQKTTGLSTNQIEQLTNQWLQQR